MPILQIDTNLSKSIVPNNFGVKTCELLADIFKSPLNVRHQIQHFSKTVFIVLSLDLWLLSLKQNVGTYLYY